MPAPQNISLSKIQILTQNLLIPKPYEGSKVLLILYKLKGLSQSREQIEKVGQSGKFNSKILKRRSSNPNKEFSSSYYQFQPSSQFLALDPDNVQKRIFLEVNYITRSGGVILSASWSMFQLWFSLWSKSPTSSGSCIY